MLNCDYPSTRASIEQHAATLHAAIEARQRATGVVDELYCVGHSLGGLVIEEYLRRADARPVTSAVYIATPHRGAVLCDLRQDWWPFQLFMGSAAALQLSPGDPLHGRPIPGECLKGCDNTGMQHPSPFLEQTAIGHLMREGVLKRIFALGEQPCLIEKLGGL